MPVFACRKTERGSPVCDVCPRTRAIPIFRLYHPETICLQIRDGMRQSRAGVFEIAEILIPQVRNS
jgi:hypothetical protein